MTYAKLYPSLVLKNLIQPRNPPRISEPPWWFKPDLHCAFHKGSPGHDIENCYLLKYEVKKIMKSGMVSFEDRAPNVKANLLPPRGNASMNMVDGCPGEFKVYDVLHIRQSLVAIHKDICVVIKTPEWVVIQFDSSNNNNVNRSVSSLVIRLAGHIPYAYDKVVPYKYNATMIKNGQEVPLPVARSVVNITDITKVTHSGRVFSSVFLKFWRSQNSDVLLQVMTSDPTL
ncbi:hypothetical protein KIW84_010477 [Lathyrus oleraceus]|uniref:Gag-pol polyprotein n=1 Tax=Pisum sativum TaxID=3888 RepID=A0A9D4YJZ9_PEA|nr:hypothetical protein KIW84_010477 [Pisum sativum]